MSSEIGWSQHDSTNPLRIEQVGRNCLWLSPAVVGFDYTNSFGGSRNSKNAKRHYSLWELTVTHCRLALFWRWCFFNSFCFKVGYCMWRVTLAWPGIVKWLVKWYVLITDQWGATIWRNTSRPPFQTKSLCFEVTWQNIALSIPFLIPFSTWRIWISSVKCT